MLGTVVLSFFICLLPFRALTMAVIVFPPEYITSLGVENYYNLVFFCRIMLYLNSAVNPILYNLMSSKFREGFRSLLCFNGDRDAALARKGTITTTTTTLTSGSGRKSSSSESHILKRSVVRMISIEDAKSSENGPIAATIKLLSHGRAVIRSDETYV
jgi:hypothetical protein